MRLARSGASTASLRSAERQQLHENSREQQRGVQNSREVSRYASPGRAAQRQHEPAANAKNAPALESARSSGAPPPYSRPASSSSSRGGEFWDSHLQSEESSSRQQELNNEATVRASEDMTSDASVGENIMVVVRVRPLSDLELQTCGACIILLKSNSRGTLFDQTRLRITTFFFLFFKLLATVKGTFPPWRGSASHLLPGFSLSSRPLFLITFLLTFTPTMCMLHERSNICNKTWNGAN
jgi:hypothetical protein